jgi:hypothetical protein
MVIIKYQPTRSQPHRFEADALVAAVDARVDKIADQPHEAVRTRRNFLEMGEDFQLP